ncbi:MAG: molybdopterin-guanine dinucleotide biosynthesis protein B [Lagierella massiliensis]|nr:molybdopterin-guanine dinucleotide biosynthesis protein B [Lagierella massiliensis]
MKITVGILSGGKSSRMGKDKASLLYNNKSFLYNMIKKFQNYPIIISNNDSNLDIKGYKIVRDKYREIGPISGILEILKASKTEYVFIIPVDMQLMDCDLIEYLYTYISPKNKIICIEDKQIHPLAALYSKSLIPILEKMIQSENYRLMDILKNEYSKIVPLKYSKFSPDILFNINYPWQYKNLIKNNIISISGTKNSGKTTFISKIIRKLSAEGYKIKYIKHDGHDFDLNESRDSNIAFKSGAISSIVFSDFKYQLVESSKKQIQEFLKDSIDYDLVIIEGLKNSDIDKFEVIRSENSSEIVSKNPIGIITDKKLNFNHKNIFDLNNEEEFIVYLKSYYLLK